MKQKNKQQKRAGKTDISPALSFILCAARRTTTQKQEAWSHSLLSFCLVHEMLHFLTYPLVFCHKMVCILFSAAFSSLPLKQMCIRDRADIAVNERIMASDLLSQADVAEDMACLLYTSRCV